MKALVYHGPAQKDWEDVPDPAVVRLKLERFVVCLTSGINPISALVHLSHPDIRLGVSPRGHRWRGMIVRK